MKRIESMARRATALLILLPLWGQAMTLETQGDTLFASGPVGNDLQAFESHLGNPEVKRVVFVNSPGGDTWSALRVGQLILDRGLSTVVAGRCDSACSIMFMGGTKRQFSDALPPNLTSVGIHGAHARDTKRVDSSAQPQLFAWYKRAMGDRFHSAVMNQALYDMDDAGAILRVYDSARKPVRVTVHCPSGQTPRAACTEFPQVDAMALGVITQADLVSLTLPASMRAEDVLFGQRLGVRIDSVAQWLEREANRSCSAEVCRQKAQDWTARRDQWAFAVGQAPGGGWARAEGRDTLQQAVLSSLYACNHRANGVTALCDPSGGGGFDLSGLHSSAEVAHAAARQRLTSVVLSERAYANEEFSVGAAAADALRTQKLTDATPLNLPGGVRTLLTRDLVELIRSGQGHVVIDVSGDVAEALPGASTLWQGGVAQDEARAEEAFDARFRKLLGLLCPDRAMPIVVYGPSRNSWLGANAAMRAQRAGWTNVMWYRGGLEAWRAANLATAPLIVRAVAR